MPAEGRPWPSDDNDDVQDKKADREASEHDESPKARELLDARQLEVVEVYQPKSSPEQSLTGLPQAENVSMGCRR